MGFDWDALVKSAENDLTRVLSARVVSGLIARFSWLGVVSGPLGFLVGLLIGQLVKYGDWLIYYLGADWMNSKHAASYQAAGEALEALPPEAPKEVRDEAERVKQEAFDRLMGAEP